jgi:hypothetical protein
MSKLGIGAFPEVDLVFTHKHEIGNAPVQIDGPGDSKCGGRYTRVR